MLHWTVRLRLVDPSVALLKEELAMSARTVLIVDGDPDLVEIGRTVESADYQVIAASDSSQGWP